MKKEDMKRILVLVAFGLSLAIPPFGSVDFAHTLRKVMSQKSYQTAKDIGHGGVLMVESAAEQTFNRKSAD